MLVARNGLIGQETYENMAEGTRTLDQGDMTIMQRVATHPEIHIFDRQSFACLGRLIF